MLRSKPFADAKTIRLTRTFSRAPGVSTKRLNSMVMPFALRLTIVSDGLEAEQRPLEIAYAGARRTVSTSQAVQGRTPSSGATPVYRALWPPRLRRSVVPSVAAAAAVRGFACRGDADGAEATTSTAPTARQPTALTCTEGAYSECCVRA